MPSLLESGRTHTCNQLRREHVGDRATLFGWVHRVFDKGGRVFVQLRDRDGITQLSFAPEIAEPPFAQAKDLRGESCIGVSGTVAMRLAANPNMDTGEVELEVDALEVFSVAATPPFHIPDDEALNAHENLRLRYRYLDLRRPSLQRNFKIRSHINYVTRRVMAELGFYELETPFMVKYTPGGARNFLVPSRLHPGEFYALAESPQIYKQLFMVAGLDKYFQITRCFRDEDLRNDRQPEFTQIDIEMSFATPERVFAAMEQLVSSLWREVLDVAVETPFRRLTWDEAMGRYGTDKPDLRFDLPLCDATDLTRECGFKIFAAAETVKGLCVPPEHAAALTRGQLDKLTEFVQKREHGGAKGLAWARIKADGSWDAAFAKRLDEASKRAIAERMDAQPGSMLLFVADTWPTVHTVLGNLRLHLRDQLELIDPQRPWCFAWVTDFPLFERAEDGRWVAAHHPFTAPRLDQLELLDEAPARVRAQAYDLVLNGNEIGGGSIRIHRSDVQAKVFAALGLSDEDAERKFGFLLEAFKYGPPPHGGIAFGLDRIAMLMCGAASLRDVIAFPKTQRGQDLMTGAPTAVDEAQLAELYLTHRALPHDRTDPASSSGDPS